MGDLTNLETQIDCFLEQFKRSASRAMEERTSPEDDEEDYQRLPCCEEIEMQTTAAPEPLCVEDVVDILHSQFAIISGGKSKDGCPIITFPDNNKFCLLNDLDYQQLMLYLTSVPSLQEADLGFHLIIDRRKDRWNSVKAVLLKISEYFPGLIHVVYVLKPTSFLQKALSEVSNTFFKEEFKFRMIFLSTEHELHEHVEPSQLTTDLGGSFIYIHEHWIKQRIELEKFSQMTQQVSQSLDEFTKLIEETELPNNVDSTQLLQDRQSVTYFDLKREILSAATHGESLLRSIKETTMVNIKDRTPSSDTIGNVFAVERLLVQLEETERTFDEFWQDHFTKLRHCLELRRFEQDFRELQINFEQHMKTVADMTEMPDSMERCEVLLRDFEMFEKLCYVDVYRAEEVISCGQHLISIKTCPLECVEPKCTELIRIRNILTDKLDERKEDLIRAKELISKIAKGNKWCANGIELLASQNIAECGNSIELATRYYEQIGEFFKLAADFTLAKPTKDCKYTFQEPSIQPLAPLVSQVTQGVENVFLMCEKRYTSLKKLAVPPLRPAGNVLPAEPVVPMQPQGGAPHPNKAVLRKAYTIPKMDSGNPHIESETTLSPENDEVNRVKRGHVLTELLETERIYVTELLLIIKGYKVESQTGDMANLLPPGFSDKMEVIFGNLEEILQFHENIFLKDLENCISSVDLVALCFVQKRDTFFRLYSYYCQNIPRSEQLRETLSDTLFFFQACQKKLGHKLPLAAYLLKPVQRITKYQLLLKDLLRYSDEGNFCKELQQALECMLVVLKCVNDSMHQISITGFPLDLSQQGDLLLQGSFSVWAENKKDIRLRIKPTRRHIFLYKKVMLFCKPAPKTTHNKATYQYKHSLKMSQIGLTESVKGDGRKFEVWLQGRQEVHTIQAANIEQKEAWVNEIKRVLFNQLEELRGEKIKQYGNHNSLKQTTSWEKQKNTTTNGSITNNRAMSCDNESQSNIVNNDLENMDEEHWSSDCTNSDDEEHPINVSAPSGRYIALADYCAIGNSEVNMREGDVVELLKVGCAGWWFVKVIGSSIEGWAPAAYLDNLHRKTFRGCSRSQDRLNDR